LLSVENLNEIGFLQSMCILGNVFTILNVYIDFFLQTLLKKQLALHVIARNSLPQESGASQNAI
jgi:hypothetical protein